MNSGNSRDIKAVLFDFDGTLAHLTIDFGRMRALVLAELVAILGPDAPVLTESGLPVMELIFAACAGQPEAVAQEIASRAEAAVSAYEVEMAAQSSLFPGILALLAGLRTQGIKVAIVTRNCRAAVDKVFPDHPELCSALVSRNDVPPQDLKPKPGQLFAAMRLLGVQPRETLMVGDHPMDIISGKASGCLTAGVLCGNASREALTQATPDWLAEDTPALFRQMKLFS